MERKMVWFFICSDETGQGLVEYALIMILVSVIAVTILGEIGDIVKDFFGIADYLGP
ncbi:Flp family type IVb pilin [Tindallia californiensis]|nr:Flp family type IVb pilin [Tindallia californiensis]